jgi:hypothetical protein
MMLRMRLSPGKEDPGMGTKGRMQIMPGTGASFMAKLTSLSIPYPFNLKGIRMPQPQTLTTVWRYDKIPNPVLWSSNNVMDSRMKKRLRKYRSKSLRIELKQSRKNWTASRLFWRNYLRVSLVDLGKRQVMRAEVDK